MEALAALAGRCSVRQFKEQPIEPALLEKIVDAGRLAATARNVQPWEFVVVTEPGLKAELAELTDHGKFIAQSAACIAVFCQDCKYYLEDGAAATQNLLVAAYSLGIGSCWVAGDKKEYAAKVGKLLGVPEQLRLVSLVPLGYPKGATQRREKRPLDEVLHWERF